MATTEQIYAMAEHGFTLTNIFNEHNYGIVLDLIGRDSARIATIDSAVFKRKFNGYSCTGKSATHFILHMLKTALAYNKPKATADNVKFSVGKGNTVAWHTDFDKGNIRVYISVYDDGEYIHNLAHGLHMEWSRWKLVSVSTVTIGDNPEMVSVFNKNSPITKETLFYSLQQVNPHLREHIDEARFLGSVKQMILNELCNYSTWTPAMEFLKHFTGDYAGIETIFNDAKISERNSISEQLARDDIKTLSLMIIKFINAIVKYPDAKYISEQDYTSLPKDRRPDRAIIYNNGSGLYYAYRNLIGDFYYLKLDDLKQVQTFYKGDDNIPLLSQLPAMKLQEVVAMISSISAGETND